MKLATAQVRSAALTACCLVAFACQSASAWSQQAPLGSALSDQNSYHDRYIAGGNLAPDISTDDSTTSDPTGLARSLRIDGVATLLTAHSGDASNRVDESGVLIDAQWDTKSYGAWSANATQRVERSGDGASGGSQGVFRLVERAMPFDGGWSADSGIGDLNGPNINLARFQSRFFLPTGPMEGISTEWRGPGGLQVIAGAGEPGIYEGIAVPTFDTLGGSTGTVGAQWSPSSQWTVGGQLATAHDVRFFTSGLSADSDRTSATTGLISTAWQGTSARTQLNLIDGSVAGTGNSLGTWLDTSINQGHVTQNFGAFRIDPNLTWANQLITNDVQGGYYQLGYQSRRWFADFGIDQAWSVSGRGLDSTFVTADARYQLSRDLGTGGVVNLRRSQGQTAWSIESYVDRRNGWGIGRGQLQYGDNGAERDAAILVSEGWDFPESEYLHLSTSAGYESVVGTVEANPRVTSSAASVSINGTVDLSARLSLNGNIRWDRTLNGPRASGLNAGVALNWQVARDWTILASYYENRLGSWTTTPTVTSPLAPPTTSTIPAANQRALFLTFRYQLSAGQHFAPLGGAPGAGSGRLTGTLYLDSNDNGRFDAGEPVAPNVTVTLDGRFSTVTDMNGHFDFPAVATGHHFVTVVPDNLPLPWNVIGDGRVEADVRTRDHTDMSIRLVRHSTLTQQAN